MILINWISLKHDSSVYLCVSCLFKKASWVHNGNLIWNNVKKYFSCVLMLRNKVDLENDKERTVFAAPFMILMLSWSSLS